VTDKKENIVKDKSFRFAIRIVNVCRDLSESKKEYVLSRQLLRSGTSIGANIREADNAESKADFIHKMSIAQKEAAETLYWLELLMETSYITKDEYSGLNEEAIGIIKLIKRILITAKGNLDNLH
jgi:four helix bundle protein